MVLQALLILIAVVQTSASQTENNAVNSQILISNEEVLKRVGLLDALAYVQSGEMRGQDLVHIVLLDTGFYEGIQVLAQRDFVDLRNPRGLAMEIPGGSIDGEDYLDPDDNATPDRADHGGRGAYVIQEFLTGSQLAIGRIGFATRSGPSGLFEDAIAGLQWVQELSVSMGSRRLITNIGFSISSTALTERFDDSELKAIRGVVDQLGDRVMLVAPAGNSGRSNAIFPAEHAKVIAVGALNETADGIHPSSNYGIWVDATLPGVMVLPNSGNQYLPAVGTSYASYLMTSLAGLIALEEPTLTPAQMRLIIRGVASLSFIKKIDALLAVQTARSLSGILELLKESDSPTALSRIFFDQEDVDPSLAEQIDGASENEILELIEAEAQIDSIRLAVRIARMSL